MAHSMNDLKHYLKQLSWTVIFLGAFGMLGDPCWAHSSSTHLEEVDASVMYQTLLKQKKSFEKQYSYLLTAFDSKNYKAIKNLNSNQQQLKQDYIDLKQRFVFWSYVSQLQKALITQYNQFHVPGNSDARHQLYEETYRLSKSLVENIQLLQKRYKMGVASFPIVHNFMIDLGLKKRGACKHWAEDLLQVIDAQPHPHFVAHWGEAHPGNIREHNVAVLVPRQASFKQGILIDPWRTGGRPFWTIVNQDSPHWQSWVGYVPR